jgi:hypothetical protein
MARIPLRDGKSTPEFVKKMLAVFGNNPHGEPNYRLIWSERKMIFFAGEIAPEYAYLDPPCWVLETWLPPEKGAGPSANWNPIMEALLGEYPSEGLYFYSQQFPTDWWPSEENVRLLAKGIEMSKHVAMKDRMDAIREGLKEKERAGVEKTAEQIEELFDSASLGKIQQGVSGPKNNFRTPEDFERDQERIGRISHKDYAHLPKAGGKILN